MSWEECDVIGPVRMDHSSVSRHGHCCCVTLASDTRLDDQLSMNKDNISFSLVLSVDICDF